MIIKRLIQMNLASNTGGKIIPTQDKIHLPKMSPLTSFNHGLWRQRAVEDSLLGNTESIHFTAIYSLSDKDKKILRGKLLSFLDESKRIVEPSDPEDVSILTLDMFSL